MPLSAVRMWLSEREAVGTSSPLRVDVLAGSQQRQR
jgi:hypothetical protein